MKSARSIKILTGISIAVLAISAVSALAFGTVTASINKIDVFNGIEKRPEKKSTAMNYLLVGSDTREGLSKVELKALRVGSVASAAGKRSDTMLLVHISKARDKAVMISIPRDTFALIPEHTSKTGKLIPAVYSKINSSFNWGGAPLLIQTIEEMTELKIDHYIEINFAGFARIVDSIGGVEICTKKNINDPKIKEFDEALKKVLLNLAKRIVIDGEGASKFITINVQNCKNENDAKKLQTSFQILNYHKNIVIEVSNFIIGSQIICYKLKYPKHYGRKNKIYEKNELFDRIRNKNKVIILK